MPEIYLDNNATTRVAPEVIEAMMPWLDQYYGNASSKHKSGVRADRALRKSRQQIASLLQVSADSVLFTSGGTEGNNLALKGLARMRKRQGKHILTTAIEHVSVLQCLGQLEKEGFEITKVQPDSTGIVSVEKILANVRDDTILISMMYVNNETGAIMPVNETAKMVKENYPRILFHSDIVQAFGKIEIRSDHIDALTLSGHKIHAPKGIGVVTISPHLEPEPLFAGGEHEFGRRAGTENISGIVAFERAANWMSENREKTNRHLQLLKNRLWQGIDHIEGVMCNTPNESVANTLNVAFPHIPGEVMMNALSEEEIYVSTGSACSTRKRQDSHVLQSMDRSEDEVQSSIRFSMSVFTTEEEIDQTIHTVCKLVPRLRKIATLQKS